MAWLPKGAREYPKLMDKLYRCYDALLRRRPSSHLPWRKLRRRVFLRGAGDFYVRMGSSDFQVIEEVWTRGEYSPLLQTPLGPIRRILDLGSNIGATVRFWQRHFPAASICAVEPDSSNLALCKKNALKTQYPVTWIHGCAASAAGYSSLERTSNEWAYKVQPLSARPCPCPVRAYSIPDILKLWGNCPIVDLLKSDIEGAEKQLFANCSDWIWRFRHILIELHHPYSLGALRRDLDRNKAELQREQVIRAGAGYEIVLLTIG